MKIIITFLLLTFSMPLCLAQTSAETKIGDWYTLDGTHTITEKLNITTGVQLRTYELTDNKNLILYYTGANYNLNPNMAVSVGGYYIDVDKTFDSTGTPHIFEKTIFEQISYNYKLSNLTVYNKLRLENRFLKYMDTNTINHRIRYCLGTKINMNKHLFLNLNNEFFC